MKTKTEENDHFKEQYMSDTEINSEKILEIVNFKIEENKVIMKEILGKNINALVDQVCIV